MNDQKKCNKQIDTNIGTVNNTRRFLSKAGIVTPVMMMLGQRPAFGAVCTVSGFISATPGNVSAVRHEVTGCGGLSPGAWRTPYSGAGDWTLTPWSPGGTASALAPEGLGKRGSPGDPSYGTLMEDAFAYSGGYLVGNSMYDVLWMNGSSDPGQLGAHLVAALLNAAAGLYPSTAGLTVSDVQNMYFQLSSTGSYAAAPSILWTPAQVVTFIQQTFG